MDAINCGEATKDGLMGADYYLIRYGKLPDYYIDINNLRELGWKDGKSPSKYAPGKMLTRGRYFNDNKHLPDAPGRLWFECDINYYEGRRNQHRILYSNDGLMFVTYDHYETFYEIINETEN